MTLGRAPEQGDIWRSTSAYCDAKVSPTSIYGLLHRESHRLFPDDAFADLFSDVGRRSVPPRVVAVVMVLQRIEGLSDREAADHFTFDMRWKYAAGGLDFEYPGFAHTVLVDMRARLRNSKDPDRIFDTVLDVARSAGLVGRKRVLDSTALYDAVATQDTVTMIRSAIRGLLRVAKEPHAGQIRSLLKRDDDYGAAGKPMCDWDDSEAREALVDALARDAHAALAYLDGLTVPSDVAEAAKLLATVVGQDLEETADKTFRIARKVAKDRVISTVDPEARHGHKTAARSFDGYKGHVAIDPDSEIITSTVVTPGNVADGAVAKELLEEILPSVEPSKEVPQESAQPSTEPASSVATSDAPETPGSPLVVDDGDEAREAITATPPSGDNALDVGVPVAPAGSVEVFGDASYGTMEVLQFLEERGAVPNVKVAAPAAREGLFSKDDFQINLDANTVTCPNGRLVQIRLTKDGSGRADFGIACQDCPLAPKCTKTTKGGRTIRIHPHERKLHHERTRQKKLEWRANYKATRPKVERKIAHMMRRRHGGRRARVRGVERVAQDFAMLGAAINLQRLARLGVRPTRAARSRPRGPRRRPAPMGRHLSRQSWRAPRPKAPIPLTHHAPPATTCPLPPAP